MRSDAEMTKRPEKSSFLVTCNLLSHYIKEKCSLADLGHGMPTCILDSAPLGKPEAHRPLTTMSLLPGLAVSSDDNISTKSMEFFPRSIGFDPAKAEAKDQEKSQLTLFYDGKVLVFDNFPDEKATDLMQLLSKGQNFTSRTTSMVSSGVATPVVDAQSSPATAKPSASLVQAHAKPNFSDLPIARKASLHRFLEKRKDRINAKAPYQPINKSGSKNVVTVKEEISQPWLGLGPHMLKPGLNYNYN